MDVGKEDKATQIDFGPRRKTAGGELLGECLAGGGGCQSKPRGMLLGNSSARVTLLPASKVQSRARRSGVGRESTLTFAFSFDPLKALAVVRPGLLGSLPPPAPVADIRHGSVSVATFQKLSDNFAIH
ncbi:hypothetical protein KM043_005955 [Ampulex compressa]|nr:hypothetical protein KM043_005955 [Ampulex compressa]